VSSEIQAIDCGGDAPGLLPFSAVRSHPKHRKILGDALRDVRKAAGVSQERLAEKADLHPNYIGEVERGEKNVSVDALVRIAAALKVSVTRFFPGI
jgi:DNA-binding XRE family transcriptional regulator